MKTLEWNALNAAERVAALERPAGRVDPVMQSRVREIVAAVRDGGWDALSGIAREIDGAAPIAIAVAPAAAEARRVLAASDVAAIELAARNVRAFHDASLPADLSVETMPGLTVRKLWRAIGRVGLYVCKTTATQLSSATFGLKGQTSKYRPINYCRSGRGYES